MTFACPKDPLHQSIDPDYCSVCGAKMSGAPSLLAQPATGTTLPETATPSASTTLCPVCQTPRAPGARFCEVCRHNFFDPATTGAQTTPLVAAPVQVAPAPVQPAPLVESRPFASASEERFEIAIVVDASLYLEADPGVPAPTDCVELSFPLDLDDNLIGRWSARNANKPEIPVGDPGASARHAKISRGDAGVWTLLDLGSTNGTYLNGQSVAPGVKTTLSEGDQITLGCWSRLTLRRSR